MREFPISSDLKFILDVYAKCGFTITNLKLHSESSEYAACSFELDGQKVEYRVSKITPTKTGQFVTIWKRNNEGITAPFDVSDLDFIVITSKSGDKIGQFIFPKSVLVEKGIITSNGKQGKRGIRVYPPWDNANSKQAEQTQRWQTNYFVLIERDNSTLVELTKKFKELFQNNLNQPSVSHLQIPSK
ncbi:MAG TPA: MepB family protein [Flavobacterium sp.]|uniref:MepB family protein n=1 Tax=unclassified Flavobacterium TaxID=196869 RepID=UPI0025C589D1|nr:MULTISPECIES: MepB family protein [unclassified Flavobacterium]HRE78444.1 MepB family protein [Flavobacterium sp.]